MMHYGYGHFGGGLYMILFWILLIIGIGYLISRSNISFGNNSHRKDFRGKYRDESPERTKSPEEIARTRYAEGEIDKDELEEILKELNR
mgnify:CR=1 FL=1